MRISARAIIIQNNKVLMMFRRKIVEGVTNEYYVIPGGGQEKGESLKNTVVRELKEEMKVDIKVLGYLGKDIREDGSAAHFFHCEIVKGHPEIGGEELDRMSRENYYQPMFVDIKELSHLNAQGETFVHKALLREYQSLEK